MSALTTALLITLALCVTCIWTVAILRKQPGLRRRRDDPQYKGPGRRMTDCSREIDVAAENEVEAANNETKVEEGDMMQPSTTKQG